MGNVKMMISANMFKPEFEIKYPGLETQCPGMVGFQPFSTGVHMKMERKVKEMPNDMTKPIAA